MRIGPYTVSAVLGEGATARVFRACRGGGEAVALKVPRPGVLGDALARQRWSREADAMRRLGHPNLPTLLDAGLADWRGHTVPYLAMSCLPGATARTRFARRSPTPDEAAALARGVLSALTALHESRMLHLDVKPDNVMLGDDGSVRLLDLGTAWSWDDEHAEGTNGSRPAGTPAFAAPEVLAASPDVDGRADLYSLGRTLGTWDARGRHSRAARRNGAAGTPFALWAFAERLRAREPDRRPPDARTALAELDSVLRRGARGRAPLTGHLPGRGLEEAALEAAWAAARAGHGHSVLVEGPAGIGKTAFVERFLARRQAERGRAAIRRGAFQADAHGPPLEAFAEALTRARSGRASRPTSADDFLARFRAEVGQGPVLLVLEDLHFARRSAHDLFARFCRVARGARALVVATRRPPEEPGRGPPPAPGLRRLVLPPLGGGDIAALVAGRVREPATARRLGAQIWAASGGLPLAAVESLKELEDRGALVRLADGGLALPPGAGTAMPRVAGSLRAILRARFGALPRSVLPLAELAACLGSTGDLGLLAEAAGMARATLRRRLRPVAGAGGSLRLRAAEFAFAHEWHRRALLDGCPKGRLAAHYSAIARALEARGAATARPATVCTHWIAAGATARVAPLLLPAFRQLTREEDIERVAATWDAATALGAVVDDDRSEALGLAVGAMRRLGRQADMEALAGEMIGRAGRRGGAGMAVEGLRYLGEVRVGRGDISGGRALFVRAAALARRAGLVQQWLHCSLAPLGLDRLRGRTRRALRELPKLDREARRHGEARERRGILAQLGFTRLQAGRTSDGLRDLRVARRLAGDVAPGPARVQLENEWACGLLVNGRPREARAALLRARQTAESIGFWYALPYLEEFLARAEFALGDFAAMGEHVAAGLSHARECGEHRLASGALMEARAAWELSIGRFDDAAAHARAALASLDAMHLGGGACDAALVWGQAEFARGRYAQATRAFGVAHARARSSSLRAEEASAWSWRGQAAARAGRPAEARRAHARAVATLPPAPNAPWATVDVATAAGIHALAEGSARRGRRLLRRALARAARLRLTHAGWLARAHLVAHGALDAPRFNARTDAVLERLPYVERLEVRALLAATTRDERWRPRASGFEDA